MNKIILVIVLIVVALLVVVFFSTSPSGVTPYLNVSQNTNTGAGSPQADTDDTTAPLPTDNAVVVEITSAGFSPASVVVSKGMMVRFINKDTAAHWPASGVHPAHLICPGFDSLKGLSQGESYEFTFNTVKTCPMHDHLNPALRGSIVVQ